MTVACTPLVCHAHLQIALWLFCSGNGTHFDMAAWAAPVDVTIARTTHASMCAPIWHACHHAIVAEHCGAQLLLSMQHRSIVVANCSHGQSMTSV